MRAAQVDAQHLHRAERLSARSPGKGGAAGGGGATTDPALPAADAPRSTRRSFGPGACAAAAVGVIFALPFAFFCRPPGSGSLPGRRSVPRKRIGGRPAPPPRAAAGAASGFAAACASVRGAGAAAACVSVRGVGIAAADFAGASLADAGFATAGCARMRGTAADDADRASARGDFPACAITLGAQCVERYDGGGSTRGGAAGAAAAGGAAAGGAPRPSRRVAVRASTRGILDAGGATARACAAPRARAARAARGWRRWSVRAAAAAAA